MTNAAMTEVCNEIIEIMESYHEQAASPDGVCTPGGLEHMRDVWQLLQGWALTLQS